MGFWGFGVLGFWGLVHRMTKESKNLITWMTHVQGYLLSQCIKFYPDRITDCNLQ